MFKKMFVIGLVSSFLVSCGGSNPTKKEKVEKVVKEEVQEVDTEEVHKMSAYKYKEMINKALEETKGNVFDFDRYEVNPSYSVVVEAVSAYMSDYSDTRVIVAGHCDNRGSREYNLALGEKRAQSVKNALLSKGIDSNRISVISYGEERPLNSANNEGAWADNRRVEYEF